MLVGRPIGFCKTISVANRAHRHINAGCAFRAGVCVRYVCSQTRWPRAIINMWTHAFVHMLVNNHKYMRKQPQSRCIPQPRQCRFLPILDPGHGHWRFGWGRVRHTSEAVVGPWGRCRWRPFPRVGVLERVAWRVTAVSHHWSESGGTRVNSLMGAGWFYSISTT